MIERALILHEPIHQLLLLEKKLKKQILSDKEQKLLQEIQDFLKIFKDATVYILGEYPTLSSVILIYNILIDFIKDLYDEKFNK